MTTPSKLPMLERLARKIVRLHGLRSVCFETQPSKPAVIIIAHVPGTERLSFVKITIEPERMADMSPKPGTYNKGI